MILYTDPGKQRTNLIKFVEYFYYPLYCIKFITNIILNVNFVCIFRCDLPWKRSMTW